MDGDEVPDQTAEGGNLIGRRPWAYWALRIYGNKSN